MDKLPCVKPACTKHAFMGRWKSAWMPYKKTRIWLAKGFLWPLKTQKGEPLRARLKYKRENMLFSYAY